MKNHEQVNKIDEWIEQFDYDDLSIEMKEFVLSVMEEKEYNELRNVFLKTCSFFEDELPIIPHENIRIDLQSKIVNDLIIYKLINYKIPVYKVVATIIVLFGLMFLFFNQQTSINEMQLAMIDTVFVDNFDTIRIHHFDTIEIVKTEYKNNQNKNEKEDMRTQHKKIDTLLENYTEVINPTSLNPDDIDKLIKFSKSNSIKHDHQLASYIVNKY
jgi:hypothetical protein